MPGIVAMSAGCAGSWGKTFESLIERKGIQARVGLVPRTAEKIVSSFIAWILRHILCMCT